MGTTRLTVGELREALDGPRDWWPVMVAIEVLFAEDSMLELADAGLAVADATIPGVGTLDVRCTLHLAGIEID